MLHFDLPPLEMVEPEILRDPNPSPSSSGKKDEVEEDPEEDI